LKSRATAFGLSVVALALSVLSESARAQAGTWAFEPKPDPFDDSALLDLRSLNENQSGETGFVTLSEDGNDFARGDGKPIRFWAVGSDLYRKSPEEMDRHCRFLAKLGVNLVRLHATVAATKEGSAITDVNEEEIAGIFRFVKAAKANGIYLLISPYYGMHATPRSWGLDGFEGGEGGAKPWGVIFFNPKMQAGYRAWTKALYTRVNPHTGLAIKDDPTVAILQVHNEDSLLFWTFQSIPKPQLQLFGKQFAAWLTKQYGSMEKVAAAWQNDKQEGDDLAAGTVAVLGSWHLTQDWQGGIATRVRDQLRFMAETQRAFYADTGAYLRTELGCRQLLNATNWRTADDAKLKEVERWTYAALEIDAENEYYGSDYQHVGENNGYRIDPDHFIVNESCLHKPLELPVNFRQQAGHPFVVTETSWKHPNLYQAEGPFLAAAYQSLSGLDAVCWFSATDAEWNLDPRFPWWNVRGINPIHKWTTSVPMLQGMFPANALLYRRGYLKQGETVLHEERPLDDLWDRKPPLVDDNEIYGVGKAASEADLATPRKADGRPSRAAFLVGRVESVIGDKAKPNRTKTADLSPHVDGSARTIRSSTGELTWDWGNGVCRMDAPNAQGVAGFLKSAGGTFELGDVTIASDNDYATVQVVSIDGQPLATSARILVQVGTTARLTGWATRPAEFEFDKQNVQGEQIVNTGKPPWRIADARVRLSLKNAGVSKATLLDAGGYAARDVPVRREGNSVTLELPPDTMYVLLERPAAGAKP
jgi:hypothetical protein